MAEPGVITHAIRSAIGVESAPVRMEVEKGMLRRFVEAVDDANPLWMDGAPIAPPTFVRALADMKWTDGIMKLDCPLKRILNGGNEIELFEPIRPGDVISVTNKLLDAKERPGKTGPMLFLTLEATFKNGRGQPVAQLLTTVIRY